MTEEEKQAAAYLKLQDDVRQLIVDTIHTELRDYGSSLYAHMTNSLLRGQIFKDQVKQVIKDQMNKY